jgi:hypothetical protein
MSDAIVEKARAIARPVWPPTLADLQRLYVDEHLSAAKIANVYGLKYASPKTAESTVLHWLKKLGIERRERAEHIRKVTDLMVQDWIGRYRKGESLKQIAGAELSPVTIFLHLRKSGIRLRNKVEAQIEAVTKHRKRPFSGDLCEKAYLLGFARGDLYVTRHGRAIRVKTATTHPAMADLFVSLFSKYGHVYMYPKKAPFVTYEWSMDSDLDESFRFLERFSQEVPDWVKNNKSLFIGYFSGLFDAEGSILLHTGNFYGFEIYLTNSDLQLLEEVQSALKRIGYSLQLYSPSFSSISPEGHEVWRLGTTKFDVIRHLIERCVFRHPQRKAKARILLNSLALSGRVSEDAEEEWICLRDSIKADVDRFIRDAHVAYDNRRRQPRYSSASTGQ